MSNSGKDKNEQILLKKDWSSDIRGYKEGEDSPTKFVPVFFFHRDRLELTILPNFLMCVTDLGCFL